MSAASSSIAVARGFNGSGSGINMRRSMRYDVFLSFRGPDVRRGFLDHLYSALTGADIHVFLDAHQLTKGDDIGETLEYAIQRSRIKIPIFSPDYAASVWCLKEVALIASEVQGRTIPLFYKVLPSHVRHPEQCGSPFAWAFQYHQSSGRHSGEEVDEWKAALLRVSNLSGWSLQDTNGYEAALVKRVVEDVGKHCKGKGRPVSSN
eukprot:PITA_06159